MSDLPVTSQRAFWSLLFSGEEEEAENLSIRCCPHSLEKHFRNLFSEICKAQVIGGISRPKLRAEEARCYLKAATLLTAMELVTRKFQNWVGASEYFGCQRTVWGRQVRQKLNTQKEHAQPESHPQSSLFLYLPAVSVE